VVALDHDGKDVWRRDLGKFVSRHGFGVSPMIYEDLVILANNQEGESFLIALDRKSGETRWKVPRKTLSPQSASYATPMIYTGPSGEDELIVASWGHGISSHNPKTGEVNWELPVFKLRPVGSPIVAGGLIWGSCGEGAGTNSVVAIDPGDKPGEASVVYASKINAAMPYVPTMIAAGDLLFLWGDRGIVACIDPRTRKEHWRHRVGGDFSASPIRIGDRIFGVSWQGEMIVLAAEPTYREIARNDLGDETRATPAVADGTLYIRTQSKLMSIGGKKS
jgi:outer membrane protein assembly factor BamB